MKKLYEEQKISLYKLQKLIGVGKNTLYRYALKERNIENMPTKTILDISYIVKIEPNKLFEKMKDYLK